jgi:hypothetical protein
MSLTPNYMDITDDLREKAFMRTTEVLRKLDEIRSSLELPPEQLPIVIETYGQAVQALLAEAAREDLAKRTKRVPLTLRSETPDGKPLKIQRGQFVEIIERPQYLAFQPEDLGIHGDRSLWMIHDLKVGDRSQFASNKRGPTPGTDFGPGGVLEHLRLETAQTAMNISIIVEYTGSDPQGAVFEATMVGTSLTY